MPTRSDAWEAQLPAETAKELYRLTKCPTEEEAKNGRPWLRDFDRDVLPYLSLQGIVAPSRAGWYRFLGRMRKDEAEGKIVRLFASRDIAQRMAEAKVDFRVASDFMTALAMDEATKDDEQRNDEAMKIYSNAAAMFASSAQRDKELQLKADKGRRDDEALRLAREKFEAAERRENAAKGAIADAKLTDEQRMAKLKEIYGI